MRAVAVGAVTILLVLLAATPDEAVGAHGGGVPAQVVAPVDGAVVAPFDPPDHRFGPGHRGVDLAAEPGTPVRAALAGIVTFSGEVAGRGWVTVDHGGGLVTTYGVLDPREVAAGRHVAAGHVLGRLAASAEHLDWGARLHGEYIDPLRVLGRWRPHLVALPR